MSDILFLAIGLGSMALLALYARRSRGCEAAMIEAVIGLCVALALGGYLVATLLMPERF